MSRGEAEVNICGRVCSKHCKGQELIPGSINSLLDQDPVFGFPFWQSMIQSGGYQRALHQGGMLLHDRQLPLALSETQMSEPV